MQATFSCNVCKWKDYKNKFILSILTKKMHFNRSIVTKQSPPAHDPLRYSTLGGGEVNLQRCYQRFHLSTCLKCCILRKDFDNFFMCPVKFLNISKKCSALIL